MMENSRALSQHNPRVGTVAYLIIRGLGYCCEWFFWQRYRNVEMIAARLGVEVATVRRHRLWFANGEFACQDCANCMRKYLPKETSNDTLRTADDTQ